MNKKILITTTLMLVICLAVFANTVMANRNFLRPNPKMEVTPITVFNENKAGIKLFSLPFGDKITKDNLVLFCYGRSFTLEEAIEKHIVDSYIFVFNNREQKWKSTNVLEPGKVYTITVLIKDEIKLCAEGSHRPGEGPVMLYTGWNYFGIPQVKSVQLKEIRMFSNDMDYSRVDDGQKSWINLRQAWLLGIVDSGIYHMYNPAPGETGHEYLIKGDDLLMPGEVYCIYCYHDGVELSFS